MDRMKRHISFGSIEQFRNVITGVKQRAQYIGKDDDGKPMYDKSIRLPKITVTASEKIHGTNAAVCYNHVYGMWVQSKENIITPENDNFGCAAWVKEHENEWGRIIMALGLENKIDLNTHIISVYFEWCGGSIQKNSAVSGLDRRAIIFEHFKVSPAVKPDVEDGNSDEESYWLPTTYSVSMNGENISPVNIPDKNIFNIMKFPTYTFDIDFENPKLSQNAMIEKVAEIEAASPVGKEFGQESNIGEGIVCTFMYKDKLFRFKVKGDKHSKSNVKKLKPVDEEKEKAKVEFANYACPAWRLEQAWDKTFLIGSNEEITPDVKMTGDFLRLVITDVMKEESDILKEKGLEAKEVNGMISKVARQWFMEQLDKVILG